MAGDGEEEEFHDDRVESASVVDADFMSATGGGCAETSCGLPGGGLLPGHGCVRQWDE